MSRSTVRAGLKELETGQPLPGESTGGRLRSPGGGRKRLTERDPKLAEALEGQLDPVTRGDPMGPLRWTCSSAARLAERLRGEGHRVSERTVNRLLHEMGYSLQGNRKTLEGRQHPDRDTQFRYISGRVEAFQRQGQPVVSVDTKKKESDRSLSEQADGSGDRRGSRKRSRFTTLSIRSLARRFPMGFTT